MIKFRTIYADPPWKYNNKHVGGYSADHIGEFKSGSADKYSVMSVEEIKRIPVYSVIDNDCCLFLWTTVPFLPDGLSVLETWGFKYKTTIFWRKIMSMGMGYWFRGQVEMCLLGIKGNIKPFRCQKCNVIQSKVRKHSEKPVEMYELIELVAPDPKLELFARNKRKGWYSWGDQIDNDIEIEL